MNYKIKTIKITCELIFCLESYIKIILNVTLGSIIISV